MKKAFTSGLVLAPAMPFRLKPAFVLLPITLLLVGCRQQDSRQRPDGDQGFILNALRNSPSYQSLKGRSKATGFIIDESAPDWCVVSIGKHFAAASFAG